MLAKISATGIAARVSATAIACAVAVPLFAADGLEPRAGAAAVTVTKAAKACFSDTVAVTGILIPKEEMHVRPERDGLMISQVLVEDGARVTAGQPLIRLTQPNAPADTPPTTLTAPVAGTVLKISATPGTLASPGGDPLVQIVSGGEIELVGMAVAKQLARLSPGQQAKVAVVGVGDVAGQVRQRASMLEPMTQLGQVRVSLAANPSLHVGAFGRAVITVGESCGVSVPMSAVLYGNDGSVVQTIRDNRVETRKVTVGLLSSTAAEIREGVAEGDMIVSRAGSFLRDGDRVRPVLELPAAKK